MISLFLNTSVDFLSVAIVKDDVVLDSFYTKLNNDLSKITLSVIDDMLNRLSISKRDIDKIVCVNGPGSFTGARIALLYVRTLAQLNNQIKIYTTNTYSLLSSLNKKFFQRKFFIFATKNKSYLLTNKSVKIVNKHAKESQINYDLLLSNFDKFLNTFTLSSLENLQPTYASQPQIGEIKK